MKLKPLEAAYQAQVPDSDSADSQNYSGCKRKRGAKANGKVDQKMPAQATKNPQSRSDVSPAKRLAAGRSADESHEDMEAEDPACPKLPALAKRKCGRRPTDSDNMKKMQNYLK